MTKADTLKLLDLLADELHDQADERQQRAIEAETARSIPDDTRKEWAMSFAASYQVLRGMALSLDNVVEAASRETG